jgi:type IV pilus assembly protein PilM
VVGYAGPFIDNIKDEKEFARLAELIRKLHNEARISKKEVAVSLAEKDVFTRVVKFPLLTDREIDSAVKWEADQYIPIPINEAVVQHQILERNETTAPSEVIVLLVAASQALVEKYVRVLSMAGLTVSSVETELISASRALAPGNQSVVIADLGASSTDIAICKNGNLYFSRSIPTAGDAITRAVSQGIGVDVSQAEEYKKTYGLSEKQLEGKVKQSILPIFKVIVDEIKKALQYYQSEEKKEKPNQMILIGGSSGLPEVAASLTEALGMEVTIGNPFANIAVSSDVVKQLAGYSPLYSVAVGLALRG